MATKSNVKIIEVIKFIYFPLWNSLFVYRWMINFCSTLQWAFLKKKFKKSELTNKIPVMFYLTFYPSKKWTEAPLIKKTKLYDSTLLSKLANNVAQ